jgi:hypothetical protein
VAIATADVFGFTVPDYNNHNSYYLHPHRHSSELMRKRNRMTGLYF